MRIAFLKHITPSHFAGLNHATMTASTRLMGPEPDKSAVHKALIDALVSRSREGTGTPRQRMTDQFGRN